MSVAGLACQAAMWFTQCYSGVLQNANMQDIVFDLGEQPNGPSNRS